ncbi:NHLP bacteriocin export ABC transporter permease/ATPase subunit [Coleofasciculus chthonoplastes]|uniref:NHLP bacteriocin export ABC transporter permease/ATPase subunit n=1 Tax=Coleofasciculus chthonoplastes TaxID=64178 RepID=UPI0032FEAFEF
MQATENTKSAPEQLHRLKRNQTLLLDDPQTVWIIESGAIALFAVTLKQNHSLTSRRYLFTAKPTEAVFGVRVDLDRTGGASDQQRCLLAVAVEETVLRHVSQTHLEQQFADCPSEIGRLVEGWIHQLGRWLSHGSPPVISLETEGIQHLTLSKGQKLKPKRDAFIWVRVIAGEVSLIGNPQLDLSSHSQSLWLPLSDTVWLEATDTAELDTVNLDYIRDLDTLLLSLNHLHDYFFRYIQLALEQEMREELQRFRMRERLNRQMLRDANRELASVLKSQDVGSILGGTELLVAVGAVGRALGVTINPPRPSEDLQRVNELEAIARASQIRMRQVLLVDHWWTDDSGPLLAYTLGDKHPVALLRAKNGYELFNPQDMVRTAIDAEVAATLDPVAYMFYRPLPAKPLKSLDIAKFGFKGTTKDLLIILLVGIASTLLGMITPWATGIMIEEAIPNAQIGLLWQICLAPLAAAFGAAAFELARGFAMMRMETIADASTQSAVWDRLLKLSVPFFRQYSIGDLESRVSAIGEIRSKLSGTTLRTIFTSFFSLFNLGLLFYYSAKLALLAVGVAIVAIAFTTVFGILTLRQSRPLQELKADIFGIMVQLIGGVAKLKVAGAEERAFAYWSKQYSKQQKLVLINQQLEDIVQLFNTLLPTISSAVLFWLVVTLNSKAQASGGTVLSIGSFLAFNLAFGTFINGAGDLSNTLIDVLDVVTLWKRAEPILKATPELNPNSADPGRLSGKLALERVTFRYRDDGPLILQDVSLYANPGEFIAFVGPSGSGKSTVLRMLLGFETPVSGTVSYDGQDLAGLDIYAVRRQLGVVMQNGRIMSASMFENISAGALITMDEAWEAARMAGLAEDIESMPMGMHTVISEGGSNISGGQRQRLLIARSLVLKPSILLFDEATSALDNRTQAIVSESLDKLQVTRVVIAHRLSTIRNANRIYVIESGQVVQVGNYDDLANQEGLFARLIARQV